MALTWQSAEYMERQARGALALLMELARIPAPSNREEKRAAFCKAWLEAQGARGVYIDEALNVIYPVGDITGELAVFAAHSDVVFPDTGPLPLTVRDGKKIFCPGVGDDTANVVALLTAAKYIAEHDLKPARGGLLLVVNAGEEGLGNLKGSREIVRAFGGRIRAFYSFDLTCDEGVNGAVGSKRYRVEITTEGGHSYSKFGNRNAIAELAALIGKLYAVEVPEGGKTTYNVGTIRGGTSVNTIAQQAELLYEFRSDRRENLAVMERRFEQIIDECRAGGAAVTVEPVGERPCAGQVDPAAERALTERVAAAVKRHFGTGPAFSAASTDCNIPLSVGIPAVCIGCCRGAGAHTREEYVEMDSLLPGLKLALDLVLGEM